MLKVHSTGSLKRMISWSQALADSSATSVNSLRSSGSDSTIASLSRTTTSPRLSPGRKLGADICISASPDSDISTETVSYIKSVQEKFLQSESSFVKNEVLKVRDALSNKIGACLSNCWRDMIWHELIVGEMLLMDENQALSSSGGKKTKKKGTNQQYESDMTMLTQYVNEWKKEKEVDFPTETLVVSILC